MATDRKDEQGKVVTPFEDADFRNKSLDAGNIIDRRQFEQNLIRYKIFDRLTALEEDVSGLSGETTIIQQTINNPSSSTCYWHKIGNDVWYTAGDVYAGYGLNVVNKSNTARDPILRFYVGDPLVAKASLGVDDSDSDAFKIEPSSAFSGSDYIRYLNGVLKLQDSTSAPTLELINLSATELDPMVQYAVGTGPVIRWTHGLDDSLDNDWLLCAGDILTTTVTDEVYTLEYDYDGYLVICDTANHRVKKHLVDGTWQAEIGTQGSGDNQFNSPWNVCSDGTHVYITDRANSRIKKHLLSDLSYVAKIGTLGSGNDNFNTPTGICTDGTYLYVADRVNDRIVKRLCSDLSYVSESSGGSLNNPDYVCTDGTFVYCCQTSGATGRIQKFLCETMVFDSSRNNDGYMDAATFTGICTTGGYLYLTNTNLSSEPSVFFKYSTSTLAYDSEFGGQGTDDGLFSCPVAIATNGTYLYVFDDGTDVPSFKRIQKLTLAGVYVSKFGTYGGTAGDQTFNQARGISVSGIITKTTVTPARGPMIRAYADSTAVDIYPLLRARDGFQLMEDGTVDATDYVGLYAPSAITASYSLTFPAAAPGAPGHFAVSTTGIITFGQSVITTASPTWANITDNGLTASKPVFTNASKVLVSTGTMPVDQGGTGLASYAIGDLLYASTTTALSKLADVATGSYLASGGVGVAPAWAALNQAAVAGLTTASSPTFAGLTIGSLSGILKGTTGVVSAITDNSSNWDTAYGWGDHSGAGYLTTVAFLDLSDNDEADYVGHAGNFVVVNGTEDGLVFAASSVAAHDILSVSHGDTAASAVSRGSIIIGNSTPKWAELAVGTVGQVLTTDGTDVAWAEPGGSSHVLLSATHTDTLADTVVRGDILYGNATPKWARMAKGAANQVLGGDGTDSKWVTACPAAAKYIVQEAHADLSAEQSLGTLATGIVYNTTTAGVGVLTTFGFTISDNAPSGGSNGDVWLEY